MEGRKEGRAISNSIVIGGRERMRAWQPSFSGNGVRDGFTVLTRNCTQCVADVRYVSSVVTAIACGSAVLPGAAPWCIEPNRPTDALHPTFTAVILHPPSPRTISTHTTSTHACCPSFKFPATTGKYRQHPPLRTCDGPTCGLSPVHPEDRSPPTLSPPP